MAETPQTGSQTSMSETASEPRTASPESSTSKTPSVKPPSVSTSPESVPAATPVSQSKSQPPKRRGKGKKYFELYWFGYHITAAIAVVCLSNLDLIFPIFPSSRITCL